ncbi:cytochrome d ubiquinol oxidase subunit II [Buchananella hordeovulneris]|uniref:Cytochrome d ubiquinol oxidase subunit II n=1 Tax=Buchananella hordeovulneris TaxID=52770 RepID=A0A1Q5PV81_9ACTO|nr:cytochrome d ubiquinol oxidase subunit II [Buchananella hordeovulneris]OKL51491.1 cytochrome d ubiquinol oxidase subunit II [Buchananella hordeovulneris]RRD44123.1 cytochrome d ubiquinol oxidase subunit II [Buchananella hordeovulneris]RRD53684.1 cytochrome d ubiquinol oxidase subunit II [Buchananella hordeovulneris]
MDLTTLWFILIAVLWTGYLFLEGFDFGVGMLVRILPRSEQERRAMLRTIGPVWDGNEVWLLTAGGATFAAFPAWYATMFAGFYLPLLLILLALIVRVCALKWRNYVDSPKWRNAWDWTHTISAYVPSLLWGVAFANLVQGMHIELVSRADGTVVPPAEVAEKFATSSHQLTGGFFSLLSPFTLLGGLVTLSIFAAHGAIFTALKTGGDLQKRAGKLAFSLSVVATVIAAVWVLWAQLAYSPVAWTWAPLVVAALALVGTVAMAARRREGWAFIFNGVAIAAAVIFIFGAMAPDVMRSAIDPAYSLTMHQASSSVPTLQIMSVVALCLVPVVLAYQGWTYWVFRKRVVADTVDLEQGAGLHPTKIRTFLTD